jgi:hypothetical protein
MSIYIENFESNADIIKEYEAPADALDGATVYLAWYGYGSYDGDSLVVFEKDGILYEVNGGHCSCMGLEGQWEPAETSWEALGMRKFSNYSGGEDVAGQELYKLVKEHTA